MKTKIYRNVVLILISLFAGSFVNEAYGQTANASLNTDCATAQLTGSDPTPFIGTWTCTTDPGVTFSNPNDPNATAFNIPFNVNVTFRWTVNVSFADATIPGFVMPVADAGGDLFPCTSNINLSATPPGVGETGIWNRTQGAGTIVTPNSPITAITGLGLGENVFRWRVTNPTTGCMSEDLVTVLHLPVTASAGPADTVMVCDDFHQMQGNDLGSLTIGTYTATGLWEQIPITAPGVLADPTSPTTMVTGLDWDDNLFRWTVTNGFCTAFDEIVIQNNSPVQPYAGRDTTICDTTYFLNGNNPTLPPPGRGTGVWTRISGDATIVNPTLYNTEVTDLSYYAQPDRPDYWNTVPAINRFEWTVTYKGCTRSDIVEVINALPLPADAGIDQSVCFSTVNLDALCEGSGAMEHWWTENAPTPTVGLEFQSPIVPNPPDNTFYNAHVEGIPAGTSSFIWWKRNTINGVVCTISDTVEVFSHGMTEDLNAGADFSYCADTARLNADPASSVFTGGDIVIGYWTITHGTGVFDNSTSETTTVRQMAYDTNIYRWNVQNLTIGCYTSDDVYITNALPSNVSAGAPQPNICDDRTTLVANRPFRGYGVWSVHSGSGTFENPSCSGDNCNSYVTNIDPGVNVYVWTVTNDYFGPPESDISCSLTDTVTITNNAITANPGDTIYMCADTAQLNANLLAGQSGTWTTNGTAYLASTGLNSSSMHNDIVRGLSLGKNTISWTVTNGYCVDSKNLVVWNNLPDPKPYANVDQVVCSDSATLTGNTIIRDDIWHDITGTIVQQEGHAWGEWSLGNGSGTIDNPLTRITKVRGIPIGNSTAFVWNAYYQFQDYVLNQTHTCQLSDTVVVSNNSVIADAGSDKFQCGTAGGTATVALGAVKPTIPATGLWSTIYAPPPGSTIVTPTAFNSSVTGMYDGTHQYKWTVSRVFGGVNCTNSDTVNVVIAVPSLANANAVNELMVLDDSVEVCVDAVTLQADQPVFGSGQWTAISGGTITNNTNTTTTVTGLLSNINRQEYVWTVNHLGCFSRDTVIIMSNGVNADASVGFDADTSICSSDFQLIGNDPNFFNVGSGTYPYDATGQWNATIGITITNNTLYNSSISGVRDGGVANVLTWTITKGGCSDADQLTIFNNEFSISANGPYNTCDGTVTLNGESPGIGGTGLWSKGALSSGVITEPSLYNTSISGISIPGNNEFIWTVNRKGCIAVDTAIVVNNKVFSYAGSDITACSDTSSFNGVPPSVGVGTWSPIVTGTGGSITISNPTLFNSHVSGLGLGLNRFTWTVSNGWCSVADTMDIINNAPSTPVTQANDEICSSIYTLSADAPIRGTGAWIRVSGSPGALINNSLSNITLVENLSTGLSTFRWTVTNGTCKLFKDVELTNNSVFPYAGMDQTTCKDSAELMASIDITANGYWTLESGSPATIIQNSGSNTTWVKQLGSGASTFRWTLEKGMCSDYDNVEVINRSVSAFASDLIICSLPAQLTALEPPSDATGLWTNLSTSPINFIDGNYLYNTRIDGIMEDDIAILRWKVSNSYCSDSVSIYVTNNSFNISAGVSDTVCSNTANLSAETRLTGSGYWTAIPGTAIIANPSNAVTSVSNLKQGDNILRWTYQDNGCVAYDEITTRNNQIYLAPMPPKTTCETYTTLIGTDIANGSGTWTCNPFDPSVHIVSPNSATTLVEGLNGLYNFHSFTWSVIADGCPASSTIDVTTNFFKANAGSKQTVSSNFTTMDGYLGSGATGTWSAIGTTASIVNPSLSNTVVNNLQFGSNLFEWTVNWNGCNSSDTVNVIYNFLTVDAGVDTSICTNRLLMKASNPAPGTGKWSLISGTGVFTDDTDPRTEVTNIQIGSINWYKWTVTLPGYELVDSVRVINIQFPLSAGVDRDICSDTITLAGQKITGATGYWETDYSEGTPVFMPDNSAYNAHVTNLGPGPNIFKWTVSRPLGCTNSAIVQISYNQPPVANFETDFTEGCSPVDVQYTNLSTGGNTYYWNFGEDQQTDNELLVFTRTYDAVYDNDEVYTTTLIAYSAAGCSDTISKQITVFKIPKVEFTAYPDIQLYPDATVYIENNSGETYPNYYWDFGDDKNQVDNSFVSTTEHTYDTWGDYMISLVASSGNCSDTARQLIKIVPPDPTTPGGRNFAGCAPLTVNFTANVQYADGYYWNFGDIVNGGDGGSSVLENPTYIYDTPGKYYVQLYATGLDGEQIPIRVDTVIVHPVPIADFVVSPDTVLLPNQGVYFSNFSTNADSYEWDFGDDSEVSFETNPVHFYLEAGVYNIKLKAFTKQKCFNSKSMDRAVVVLDPGVLVFPNAFKPRTSGPSDGKWDKKDQENYIFHPVHRGVREYRLEIFNRWGAKVFESTNIEIGWDGYIDKKLAPQDVYVWKVTAKYINGVLIKDAGDITLMR